MIPANLILNADDFGLDARVSKAIALCADEGLINSFSVFPFRDSFHDGLLRDIIARHPGIRVGAHLALTGDALRGDPPKDGSISAGFRDHPGYYRDFLKKYLRGGVSRARVHALWKEQIETLGLYLGGTDRLAHLDSHQHLHVLPGLWQTAQALQSEFGIPRLRVPYESLARGVGYRFPFGLGLQALSLFRHEAEPPAFLGFFSSMRFTVASNRAGLASVLRHPERVFELMVHPVLPAEAETKADAGSGGEGSSIEPSQAAEIGELRRLRDFWIENSRTQKSA